jgi:hypothetical protein
MSSQCVNVSEAVMRLISTVVLCLSMVAPGVATAAGTPPSETAILRDLSGKVLINVGKGFIAASADSAVKSGDSLLLGPDGFAQLYFPKAKCTALVPAAKVTVVTGSEMCQQAMLPKTVLDPAANAIITPAHSAPLPPAGEIPPLLIASGIFVIGTAAAIAAFTEKNSTSPQSVSNP